MRWQEVGRAGTIYYPIWLSYAAGLLEKEGHKIRLLDARVGGHQLKQATRDKEHVKRYRKRSERKL